MTKRLLAVTLILLWDQINSGAIKRGPLKKGKRERFPLYPIGYWSMGLPPLSTS